MKIEVWYSVSLKPKIPGRSQDSGAAEGVRCCPGGVPGGYGAGERRSMGSGCRVQGGICEAAFRVLENYSKADRA